MQQDRSPKNLFEITAQLRVWERAGFPPTVLKELQDQTFIMHFEYSRDELISPLTPSHLEDIREFCYDDVVDMAREHGFDITCPDDKEGVFLPKEFTFYEYDRYGVGGWLVEDGGEYFFVDEEPEPASGCVIRHWPDWIAMMYAKEEGLFPATDDQKRAVDYARKIKREAHKLQRASRRLDRPVETVEAVFGDQRSLKAGTITAPPANRGKRAGREIKVEVRKRRGR